MKRENVIADDTAKERVKRFKITKGIELIEKTNQEPEPKIIWKGIPEGSKGLFTGVGKTGKTTFAENLAISLSVGKREFFGFEIEDPRPRKVLFVNLEEKYNLRSRRNSKQIERLSNDEKHLFNENYISTPVDFLKYLNTSEDWKDLSEYIEASEAEFVVIDSLSHMCMSDIERSAVALELTQNLEKYLWSLNKTYLVIHHNIKGNNKPVEQENIAGSRIITQEFEHAFAFANIPGSEDESYFSMVYNKHTGKQNSTAYKYNFSEDGWITNLGAVNKYSLYNEVKYDYRTESNSKERILEYFVDLYSQSGQDSTAVSSADLKKALVETKIMSKDTFHRNINLLVEDGVLSKDGKGVYVYNYKTESENEKGNNLQIN